MVQADEPNDYTILAMVAGIRAAKPQISHTSATIGSADPHTELDTHANMCLLGRHAYIFESTGKTCNVSPFMDGLGVAKDVPIVDGAIAYDCPYSRQTYILILWEHPEHSIDGEQSHSAFYHEGRRGCSE